MKQIYTTPVTSAEMKKPRARCKNGHELTDDNIYMSGNARRCRRCAADKMKAWRDANPERARHNQRKAEIAYTSRNPDAARRQYLKRMYGITLEQFHEMFAAQNGRCKICDVGLDVYRKFVSESPVNQATTAHVDHCHSTGRVRGILCLRCNAAVGYLKDSPDLARRVAAYLEADAGGGYRRGYRRTSPSV